MLVKHIRPNAMNQASLFCCWVYRIKSSVCQLLFSPSKPRNFLKWKRQSHYVHQSARRIGERQLDRHFSAQDKLFSVRWTFQIFTIFSFPSNDSLFTCCVLSFNIFCCLVGEIMWLSSSIPYSARSCRALDRIALLFEMPQEGLALDAMLQMVVRCFCRDADGCLSKLGRLVFCRFLWSLLPTLRLSAPSFISTASIASGLGEVAWISVSIACHA